MRISRQPSPIQIMIHKKKQPKNVAYFSYLGSIITNYARFTQGTKSRIATAKAAFTKTLFTSLDLNLRRNQKSVTFGVQLCYGAKTWTLQKGYHIYLESLEMWCWRRMEEMSWNNPLRNEEVLQRVKEERNISQTIKRRNANRTCYILHRNCFLKHILERNIEGRMEVVGR